MNSRTLSGADEGDFTILNLKNIKDAIRIEGNSGVKGQTLQKDSNNKLNWGFVDDIEIPDGSITGAKLSENVDGSFNIDTTGTIKAQRIRTNELNLSKDTDPPYFILDSDGINMTGTRSITIDDGDFDTSNGNVIIRNGNHLDIYSDLNTTKTFDVDGSTGDITTTGKLITTGTETEVIRIRNGGVVNIYEDDPQPGVFIQLSGIDGKITCRDFDVTNHQGTIDFQNIRSANIRADNFGAPQTGNFPGEVYMNSDGIHLVGNLSGSTNGFDGPGAMITCSNIFINGNHNAESLLVAGDVQIIGSTGDTPQNGDLKVDNGDLTIKVGDFTLEKASATAFIKGLLDVSKQCDLRDKVNVRGSQGMDFISSGGTLNMRISPETGNVVNSVGKLTMSKAGTTPAPTDSSSYTDWAIDVSNTDGHMRVAGNIICDGKIFGDVEGAITEEEVDCQRLTLRTATPPLSGITGMIMGAGSIISNDTSGLLELTIDADLSGMVINNISVMNNTASEQALQVVGNTTISSGNGRTTTIGSVGSSGQTLEVLCNNVNLGETAGNQQNNTLNYRGGTHTFTGEKVNIGDRLGYTNVGCSLEGSTGIGTNNIYKNEIKYFNINGRHISHDLAGTTQNFVIYRATTSKGVEVPSLPGFSGTSATGYLQPQSFNFVDLTAPTNACKLTIQTFYRHYKGNPDLRCRIDDAPTGANPYTAQIGGPRIVKGSTSNANEQIHKYDFIISGLTEGNDYSFYPKFAHTTEGRGFLMYGGPFGEMYMYIEWLEFYNGDVYDPYPAIPTGEEVLGETLHSLSYVDNESQNFTRIYNTSYKWIFDGNQDSGTDTLEAHFTATTTTGYIEFGFYANSLTSGMVFMCGIASATGGTSPFATTLSSSAVSIDAYKQGLFNGDTSQYSLKELLDFTSFENTYITSKFHFNNLTIGTEYKMALYGRCHNSGSIYINAGGKSGGTTNRNAHQQAYIKFYSYHESIGGARTDDAYVPPSDGGDDY